MCENINDTYSLPDVLVCDCGQSEHQLLIYRDDDYQVDYREVIIQPHLINNYSFIKRLWIGMKYIFGYKCKYGHWDSLVITTRNYKPLKDAIEFLDNVK